MKQIYVLLLILMAALSAVSALPRNMVVVEVATGTWCQYCPGAAMACHDLLQNGDPVAIVKNHNGDTYANVYSNARNSWYGVTGYPTAYFDGVLSHVGGDSGSSIYATYLPLVNQRMAIASHYTINAVGSTAGSQYTVQVVVAKPEADANTNVKLQAVLTESDIPQAWFNQTTVENVNRLMIPDQNGTAISLNPGQETTVELNFTLNAGWVPDNCELVLFLQNMTSKEILQANKYSLNNLTGGYPASLTSYDFPFLPIGQSLTLPVTLHNYAATSVSGTIGFDAPGFSASIQDFSIPAFGTLGFDVYFQPTEAFDYSANLVITSNLWNYPNLNIPLTGTGYALAANYVFVNTMGTYTPVAGGTSLGNTTTRNAYFVDPANPLGGSATTTGPGFPIGFTFNYLGMDFDRLGISSNGWIGFGQSDLEPAVNLTSTNSSYPIGTIAAIDPARLVSRVAGFGRSLQAQAGAELRLVTTGTEPNRECVIQWTNYRRVNVSGDSFNFQLRLLENGNRIEAVYGSFAFGNTSSTTAEVGLRGLPATAATNFKNLTSTTSWADPQEGTATDSRMTISSTVYPASGTTYAWWPQAMLPEVPTLAFPANGTADLPVSGFDLGWNPPAGGGPVEYYAVYLANSEDALYDQNYWETTSTTFNPVTAGGFTFNYGERWYWTVESHNVFGAAVAQPAFHFDIENPAGLEAPVSDIGVDGTVSWEAVAGADSYRIYRADDPYGAFIQVGTATGLSWQDPAFPGDKAFYRVTAVSGE